MNSNEIHLVGLIGLRALAEYNPSEFKRSTDMTKREIERRIEYSLRTVQNKSERQDLYRELKNIIENTETQIELTFLLQQFYFTCLRMSQYYSLQNSKLNLEGEGNYSQSDRHYAQSEKPFNTSQDKELIRLSVMLMLRSLPEYKPIFDYRLGSRRIDCVLEPQKSDLPYIIIEAKSAISRIMQFNNAIKQIESTAEIFGKKVVGIIVVENFSLDIQLPERRKNIYLLRFDTRRNQFINDEFLKLLELIKGEF